MNRRLSNLTAIARLALDLLRWPIWLAYWRITERPSGPKRRTQDEWDAVHRRSTLAISLLIWPTVLLVMVYRIGSL